MHGEFKVPGGKLVVVDLEVVDGRIADFRLSGDFFLEPDEALQAIDAAVAGLPADADAKVYAAAVTAALPSDATLLGFSPEAVATLSPNMHLALDQVLAEEVGEGRRKPTLRIWEWNEPAVVIGSFQSVKNEVDPENAAKYGFEVVDEAVLSAGRVVQAPAPRVLFPAFGNRPSAP